jgi:hypothetical protein
VPKTPQLREACDGIRAQTILCKRERGREGGREGGRERERERTTASVSKEDSPVSKET